MFAVAEQLNAEKKEKLLRETYEPTLGVLRSTKNEDGRVVEHVQYR